MVTCSYNYKQKANDVDKQYKTNSYYLQFDILKPQSPERILSYTTIYSKCFLFIFMVFYSFVLLM